MDSREYRIRACCNKTASRFGNGLFGQPQGVEIAIEPFSFHQGEVVALLGDGRPDLKGPVARTLLYAKRYGSESFGRQKSTEPKSEKMNRCRTNG